MGCMAMVGTIIAVKLRTHWRWQAVQCVSTDRFCC
jgi:hypothetical protein